MGSKSSTFLALLLALNLIFFTLVNGCGDCPRPKPSPPPPPPCPPPPTTPTPKLSKPPSPKETCPKDALKLGACANLLGIININIGSPPTKPCCPLLEGLVDLEAALCLCTAIKANVLAINLNIPISLSVILNYCGRSVPSGFTCA